MLRWFFLFCVSTSFAQTNYDTIVDKGIYKSYFNLSLKQPVVVTYTLYKGGGAASRENDHFTATALTLCDKDYLHSGYDRGHLVPAEDFAYSDSLQGLTFSYYNCIPQLPKLNRGKWKKYENKVRKLSQNDTLVVVCYNEYSAAFSKFNIPDACYKSVYTARGKLLFEIGLKNDSTYAEVPVPPKLSEVMRSLSKTAK
jgi:DNA/RNA endonuclease G (NUC1)